MKIKQTNKEQHEGAPFHFLQFCSTIPLLYCNLGYRGPFLNIIPSEYERSLMTIQKKVITGQNASSSKSSNLNIRRRTETAPNAYELMLHVGCPCFPAVGHTCDIL